MTSHDVTRGEHEDVCLRARGTHRKLFILCCEQDCHNSINDDKGGGNAHQSHKATPPITGHVTRLMCMELAGLKLVVGKPVVIRGKWG